MSDYSLGVPDETGLGADAARAREVALTQHIGVSAETDRAVVPKLRQAYDSLVCGRRRLGAIGAEIENAVAHQRALGLDTPAGARNFSRFLATKAHDITRVLAATAAESQAGAARLRSLASSIRLWDLAPNPRSRLRIQCHFRPTSRRCGRRARRVAKTRTRSSGRSITRR